MDIKLTNTNDIDLTTGDLVLLDGIEAVAQHLRIRFRFYQGEWYLDTRIGMPYFQIILLKGARINIITEIFRKAILDTPGVEKLYSLDLSYDGATRVLSVEFEADIEGSDETIRFEEEFII